MIYPCRFHAPKKSDFYYEVYAITKTTDDTIDWQQKLCSGNGNTNRACSISTDVSNLPDGIYGIQFTAVVEEDNTEYPYYLNEDNVFEIKNGTLQKLQTETNKHVKVQTQEDAVSNKSNNYTLIVTLASLAALVIMATHNRKQ